MVDEKKSLGENEIELSEAISIIWNNKFKIFLSSFLPGALVFFYFIMQDPVKPIFKNSADISPITILDELEYKNYNSYLNNYRNYINNLTEDMNNLKNGSNLNDNVDNVFEFYRIDRKYLMELFIEKLSDKDFIIESIKKYGLVKKENFKNLEKYENEVFQIASLFDLSSSASIGTKFPKYHIDFETHNIDDYVGYLNFLDNLVNSEIQKYLKNNFNDSIENEKIFQTYKLEDINIDLEIRLSNLPKNDPSIERLLVYKENILKNKSIKRLENAFNSTPVAKENKFYAAKINIQSIDYNKSPTKKNDDKILLKVIITALIGAILAIFYVLILSKVRN